VSGSRADVSGRVPASPPQRVSPEVAAEAALWVARLHGPDRDAAMEREFQAWQARSPAHREAFGKCTEVWQDVPRVKLKDAYGAVATAREAQRREGMRSAGWRWAPAAGVAVALIGGALFFHQWNAQGRYGTGIGEQRLVVLDDGTRMLLNTDTEVRVAFTSGQRTVAVGTGEALFEVAKDAARPFVVQVAGSEVIAVGTAFSVRHIDRPAREDALAVTLIEGQVKVRPAVGGEGARDGLAPIGSVSLQPGDRLLLGQRARTNAAGGGTKLDRPNVEQVMAWKRREAVFQNASLGAAVEEMNRYNRTPVVLSGDLVNSGLFVSGVFRTGDSLGFARAVAALHGLTVRESAGRLELSKIR
jgi:transmembrane sensor